MSEKMRKGLQEKFNRLKKTLKKILLPGNEESQPQLILQPYRNKQRFER